MPKTYLGADSLDDADIAASQITSGTIDDARIPTGIARDAEVAAAYQPIDADLTALAAAGNSSVLAATTASFLTADETKLDGIEAGAEVNDTAAEILTKLLTVDGSGSGLDADLLDGQSSAAFATAAQGALADSATQPGDDAADLGSGAATDGYVLTADGAGGVAWETPAGGGGGGLLGSTSYDPGTAAVYTSTTTSWADMDATNLTVTFTAPASGSVVVTLEAYAQAANNGSVDWCLRDAGGNVADTEHKVLRYPPATAFGLRVSLDILVTGLTPGASTTYKWGHSRQDTGTGPSTVMGQWAGPGLMLVREA